MKTKSSNTKFNYLELQKKWDKKWQAQKIYHPNLTLAKKPYYNLMMFPYPSAEGLHVGNMYAFTGSDVFGRFMRMKGFDVFEPIGLDGFGIHSENYALKIGAHPMKQAEISEKRFYEQLHMIGNAFDWERTVETYKPDYYKWTQWLFIQLFKSGLAVKKKAEVNWCPSCKTVLADEQVIQRARSIRSTSSGQGKQEAGSRKTVGVCERCGTEVSKKELEQWFFRITIYADRLLEGLSRIDWSKKVVLAQKNWIGRSEGTTIRFEVPQVPRVSRAKSASPRGTLGTFGTRDTPEYIEVFTTRPDTLFGATFMVVSPKHGIVASLLAESRSTNHELSEIRKYVEEALKKTDKDREEKEKTGVFSGLYAINPATNERIPVWISDYVVMEYGTGAIMAVPAHDLRDFEFAKKYELSIKYVLEKPEQADDRIECWENHGQIVDSGDWTGWNSERDFHKIIEWIENKKIGNGEVRFHLRDWLISRQRYWGTPIPIIYCVNCWEVKSEKLKVKSEYGRDYINIDGKEHAIVPLPEEDLPVVLPYVENFKPLGTGVAPLAQDEEFVNTTCPNCGGKARRETDVCDTFLDSSWYFLRYLATDWDNVPFPFARGPAKNQLSVLGSQLSANSQLASLLTGQPKTGKQTADNGKQKTDNRNENAQRARWLPVDMYIGGAEHSVLHLLYSRFIWKALYDQGYFNFSSRKQPASGWDEPFTKFRAHGLLIKDSAKMSKSKGNIVNPDEYINKYGADTLRCYLMFLGPYEQGGDFRDSGMEGMERFLIRVKKLVAEVLEKPSEKSSADITKAVDRTVKAVGEDIEALRYNTAIAQIMTLVNIFSQKKEDISKDSLKTLVLLLAPFAPYMTEELWERLSVIGSQSSVARLDEASAKQVGSQSAGSPFVGQANRETGKPETENGKQKTDNWSVHAQPWPSYKPSNLKMDEIVIAVQINGKLREALVIEASSVENQSLIEQKARESEKIKKHLEGKEVKKVIFVPGKVINFVV